MTYRLLLPLVLGLAGFASSAQGAAYSTNFNSFTLNDVAGQQSWAINDPTPKLSFTADLFNPNPPPGTLSRAAALGGFNDPPALTNVELVHSYNMSLSGSSFDVDFAVIPSTASFPGRDNFGFSFRDTASNLLLSVIFKPNPAFPTQLEVKWQGTVGGEVATGFDIFDNAIYHLDVDFAAAGVNGVFTGKLTPGTGAAVNFGGILPFAGPSTIGNFGADFDKIAAAAGDNYIIFDNIAMVPEPSSALLLGLGLLGAIRRRRAA